MDYDRARPGATALHVALERLLRQETAKSLERHGVTVLLDMSTFYDTLDLQKLQQTAQDLNYPPLALEFAMQVYTGHKAILAEGELPCDNRSCSGLPTGATAGQDLPPAHPPQFPTSIS